MLKINMYHAYISKHKSNHEKQFILLMIPNREGWNYPAVEKLSVLLRQITSKQDVRLSSLREITVVFHNRSNYDYHFIIKELVK